MKKVYVIFFMILIYSCESNLNKNSRLTIDKYTRKLSSLAANIANSRKDEGNQSKMTLNNFYSNYTTSLESFINDLNFETISPKYSLFRDELLFTAKDLSVYLNCRKSAVNNMSDLFNAYESGKRNRDNYLEYRAERYAADYYSTRNLYTDLMLTSLKEMKSDLADYFTNTLSLRKEISLMDSICNKIDSSYVKYNERRDKSKLQENLVLPKNLRDTVNDWLYQSVATLRELDFPSIN